jgi:archaellum component FlaC
MAKLHTDKEKYGVSVAARIDPELAHQIADRADRLHITFAKMVSMLIARGFHPQEPIKVENREEIERLESCYDHLAEEYVSLEARYKATREAIAQFIQAISQDGETAREHIEHFKTIRDGILAEQPAD